MCLTGMCSKAQLNNPFFTASCISDLIRSSLEVHPERFLAKMWFERKGGGDFSLKILAAIAGKYSDDFLCEIISNFDPRHSAHLLKALQFSAQKFSCCMIDEAIARLNKIGINSQTSGGNLFNKPSISRTKCYFVDKPGI